MELSERYSIAYKGLKDGPHDFCFEVGSALFASYESAEIKGGRCVAEVHMERAETQLALDVTITGSVTVACDRCLEDCEVPIDFEGQLMVKFADEIREYDGEVMWLSPMEDQVDLTQYIYESVVLSLPYQRVHPQGECDPEMLEHFRIVTDEEFARIEAEAEQNTGGDWDKLAALKAEMEAQQKPEK